MIPGELVLGPDPVAINVGRPVVVLRVANTGDRPVQVGSHFHFAEANQALVFDRDAAWGQRLAVPAGTSVRFEPGIDRDVELVPLAGARVVPGLRGRAGGALEGGTPHGGPIDGGPIDGGPIDGGLAPSGALDGGAPDGGPPGGGASRG